MDLSSFAVFITMVLSIYISVNAYIIYTLRRGTLQWGLPGFIFFCFMTAWALSYPLTRAVMPLLDTGTWTYDFLSFFMSAGSYYIAVMLYLFLFFLFFDIACLLNRVSGLAGFMFYFRDPSKKALAALSVTALIVFPGSFAAVNTIPVYHEIKISGHAGSPDSMRAVLISDLHLGYQINNSQLEKIVKIVNAENPDIILIPGDIIDHDTAILEERNSAAILSGLNAEYGVFASPGNHEYYAGIENSIRFIESSGIIVLQDETFNVKELFIIAGRNDPSAEQFGIGRSALKDIVSELDRSLPLIVLDHQPVSIPEAVDNSVDLLVSGHTHHGQMFPVNFITSAIFKLSRGYKLKDNTHVFVTSGIGTWGPRIRVGSRSELVVIDIFFEQ